MSAERAIPPRLAELVENLEGLDRAERIDGLISLAEHFREVPERIARGPFPEERRVPGCESQAFVWSEENPDGTLSFHFAVENPQGISAKALAVILDFHESQSRMWENCVGRSRAFWRFFYPLLQATFHYQLRSLDTEQFYAAINRVKPSLIRVEADELTYNLHIMLRFEIEQDLIEGRTRPEDLPGIWNRKMEEYLGIVPSNDAEGVLQDVHWSLGASAISRRTRSEISTPFNSMNRPNWKSRTWRMKLRQDK